MNPTPHQLKLLKLYRDYHEAPPTPAAVIRRNRAPLTFFILIIIAGLYVATRRSDEWMGIGYFAAGLGFGALARVIRQLVNSLRCWPVVAQIVDWSKVDTLLGERHT